MPPTESHSRTTVPSDPTARSAVAAIPARYEATRLPGKMLLPLAGRPLIEHVYRRATAAEGLRRVVILTDDARIEAAVQAFGGEVELTPTDCASGTDRIAWAAGGWPEDVVINVQGDEPLIDPDNIDRLARHLLEHPDDPMATLAAPATEDAYDDPNVVKVVFDRDGWALYFSRAPIPYRRDAAESVPHRHIGIYGYQRSTLLKLAALPRSPLEIAESLEQLRALENGLAIRVLLTAEAMPGVDTMQDLERVEALLRDRGADARHDDDDMVGGG